MGRRQRRKDRIKQQMSHGTFLWVRTFCTRVSLVSCYRITAKEAKTTTHMPQKKKKKKLAEFCLFADLDDLISFAEIYTQHLSHTGLLSLAKYQ